MKRNVAFFSTSRLLRSFVLLALSVSAPYYLLSFGFNYIDTGLVLFLSTVASTLAIRLYPRLRIGNRNIVLAYTGIFAVAVLFILLFQTAYVFISALVVGAISLSGKDMTPNQPIEQYSVGYSADSQKEKNSAYTFYNFMAYIGNMMGALSLFFISGESFTLIFEISLIFIIASMIPYFFAPFPEIEKKKSSVELSPETRKTTRDLAALFATDSFAGGLITTSLLSLWFNVSFGTSLQENGLIFFIVSLITAVSILYSGSISTRMGLIRTMVYTHLISNAFLMLMPLVHSLIYSEIFLFLRQATSQMDVAPRDSLINTIIDKDSRIKTNSIFLASRNVGQIPAPAIGGVLLDWLPSSLVFGAGFIKASYDIVLYARFRHIRV